MLPFIAAAGAALKTLLSFLLRHLFKWLLAQLITIIVVYFATDLINELVEKLKTKIEDFNNFILSKIFVIEDFLFQVQHNIYDKVDTLWIKLEGMMKSTLDVFMPESFEVVLLTINFASWIDTFVVDIVEWIRGHLVSTISFFTQPILNKVTGCLNLINTIELEIKSFLQGKYNFINDFVQARVKQYNDIKIAGLFGIIESMQNWYNDSIIEIQNVLNANNATLPEKHNMMSSKLAEQLRQSGMSEDQIQNIVNNTQSDLQDVYKPVEIDFSKYLVELVTPDRKDYELKITIPELNFNISEAVPSIQKLRGELVEIETKLKELPVKITDNFLSIFPEFVRGQLESRLRQFLLIAITTVLIAKKEEIKQAFKGVSGEILTDMEDGKQKIIAKTQEIVDAIKAKELEIVDTIPNIIKPTLQKAIEKIESNVAEKQDEILVSVDGYLPNTTAVDHLVERFPKVIKANAAPNKFDSREWSLNDMYRMLCNYFSRSERIALVIHLSSQDMQLDQTELENLFPPVDDKDTTIQWDEIL